VTLPSSRAIGGLETLVLAGDAPASAPIVVMMHGIGADETDLLPVFAPWASRVVLAFPRAPHDHPPGHAWYALRRPGHPVPESFAYAQDLLASWLTALREQPGLAGRPVYLGGFSQGAFVALSFALSHPDQVAGVMAFSGLLPRGLPADHPEPPPAARTLPVFLTLGMQDHLFPYAWLEESVSHLRGWGLNPTVVPHPGGHELPPLALAAATAWLTGRLQA
jgi:phospholipase/carboxylesterase